MSKVNKLIIEFVNNNFKDKMSNSIQLENYKKLLVFLNEIKYSISIEDATILLSLSPKLNMMISVVNKVKDINHLYGTNNLFDAYKMISECEKESFDSNYNQLIGEYVNSNKNDSTTMYLLEIKGYKILSREDEFKLYQRIKNGDVKARDELIKHNLRLVVSIARKFDYSSIPLMDLVQEGNIALIKAVEKFDGNLGYKFSTFVYPAIYSSIKRYVIMNRIIKTSVNNEANRARISATIDEYRKIYGKEPTNEELSKLTNMSIDTVKFIKNIIDDAISLDTYISEENEDTLYSVVACDEESLEDKVINRIFAQDFSKEFDKAKKLTKKQKEIFRMMVYNQYSNKETADAMGISHQYVSEVKKTIIDRVRSDKKLSMFDCDNISHQEQTKPAQLNYFYKYRGDN